jgi:hypothetical protein
LPKNLRVEAERLAPLWRNMDWQGTSESQPLPRRCLAERAGEGIEVPHSQPLAGERGRERDEPQPAIWRSSNHLQGHGWSGRSHLYALSTPPEP